MNTTRTILGLYRYALAYNIKINIEVDDTFTKITCSKNESTKTQTYKNEDLVMSFIDIVNADIYHMVNELI